MIKGEIVVTYSCGCEVTGIPDEIHFCPKHKAAPEMYEALKACEISLISDEHYQEFKPLLETINKALKRAEGREE